MLLMAAVSRQTSAMCSCESINSAAGQMQLVGPNRAQFLSGGRVIATLARFPGLKQFWLCA